MSIYKQIRLIGAIACIIAAFTGQLMVNLLGFIIIIGATIYEVDDLERRLRILEGDNHAEKTETTEGS